MMARLWYLMLLCWAASPVCLPSRMSMIGTPEECKSAKFVPGYNLGGEGFDIVKMERKGAYVIDTETWKLGGNGSCKLYPNPFMNGEKQKVPVSLLDWRIVPKCSLKVSAMLYESAEALINDSTSSVLNNWKLALDIPLPSGSSTGFSLGGTHSNEATFGMRKSKEDFFTFSRHSVHCKVYRYRLATRPPLSHDFQSAVDALPSYSPGSQLSYRSLIETYGTHYITQVYLGGEIKAVTSIKTCLAAMSSLSATEVSNCLTVEASASFNYSASIQAMYKHCNEKKKALHLSQGFSSMYTDRITDATGGNIDGTDMLFTWQSNPSHYKNWLNSLRSTPDVIRYNLKPLHTILPSGHRAAAGLKKEVEKYIWENALQTKCSERCTIGHRSSKRDRCACVCNGNQNIRSNCCPVGKGRATLTVFKLYAKGLYGDIWTQTDGSVEVTYGDQIKRTEIIANNDNPIWKAMFQFGPIIIDMSKKLKFSVYDEDTYWNSDLLGQCSFDLRSGKWTDSCMLNHGTLFFSYEVKCAPSLGGEQCQEYIPTSMSPSLAEVFYTRNGVLLGDLDKKNAKSFIQSG
uniref:Uncharacterized protein n=1 Tax=Mola mola TaxID=94237 RepID=A0A3Q3WAC2_MOLML